MKIFINHFSDDGLYTNTTQLDKGIQTFREVLKLIKEKTDEKTEIYLDSEAITKILDEAIIHLEDDRPSKRIDLLLDKLPTENWKNKKKQSEAKDAMYFLVFNVPDLQPVNDTILAEIAEHSISKPNELHLILNFINSAKYEHRSFLQFIKTNSQGDEILNISKKISVQESLSSLKMWLLINIELPTLISDKTALEKVQSGYSIYPEFMQYDWDNWKPSFNYQTWNKEYPENLFPCLQISDLLVENWNTFYRELNTLTQEERIPIIEPVANQIAIINGWEKNARLSQANNRTIFQPINGSQIYMGVDTQHGEFEIHNAGGDHLGSVDFKLKTKPPVTKPRPRTITI